VSDRDPKLLGEAEHILTDLGLSDAAAHIQHRAVGLGKPLNDHLGGPCGQRWAKELRGQRVAVGEGSILRARPHVHRDVKEHGARSTGLGGPEGALGKPRQVLDPVNAPDALGEGPVNLPLIGIGVEVHLLVGVAPVVVGRDVA